MKKAVIAVVIAVIIVASIGGWWWQQNKQHKTLAGQFESQCKETVSVSLAFIRGLKDASGKSCSSIANMTDRELCTAIATSDASKCPAEKKSCPALASHDPSMCLNDSYCPAMASGNPLLCDAPGILPEDRADCVARATLDEKYFGGETGKCSEGSIIQAAVTSGNASLCSQISGKNAQENCVRMVQGTV
jgi:hypothetical protein